MLELLAGLAEKIGRFFLKGAIDGTNLFIEAVGALIQFLLDLLPSMPAVPEPPEAGFLGTFSWFVPVGSILTVMSLFVTAYVALLAVRIAMRWVKAL